MNSEPKRIPSLDGLRAVSILMVMLLHSLQRTYLSGPSRFWFIPGNGLTGVYIFFVISGFLITSLLLREFERSGSIGLGKFYLRRAFRILPPVYAYILLLGVLDYAGKVHVSLSSVLGALFFYGNYLNRPWPIGHFWSLAIEEQFYLIWPLLLLLSLRKRGRSGAATIALAVIVVAPFIRVISHFWGGTYLRHINGESFQGRADALMFGCLLAVLCGSETFERIYSRCARLWWVFPLVLIFGSGTLEVLYGNYWDFPIGYTVDGVCIAIFLLWCVRNPDSMVGRVLNSRVMVHVGVLSYSIYIWQQLFLNANNGEVFGSSFWGRVPLSYLCIYVAAALSYYCIERPSLRLRDLLFSRRRAVSTSAVVNVAEP